MNIKDRHHTIIRHGRLFHLGLDRFVLLHSLLVVIGVGRWLGCACLKQLQSREGAHAMHLERARINDTVFPTQASWPWIHR